MLCPWKQLLSELLSAYGVFPRALGRALWDLRRPDLCLQFALPGGDCPCVCFFHSGKSTCQCEMVTGELLRSSLGVVRLSWRVRAKLGKRRCATKANNINITLILGVSTLSAYSCRNWEWALWLSRMRSKKKYMLEGKRVGVTFCYVKDWHDSVLKSSCSSCMQSNYWELVPVLICLTHMAAGLGGLFSKLCLSRGCPGLFFVFPLKFSFSLCFTCFWHWIPSLCDSCMPLCTPDLDVDVLVKSGNTRHLFYGDLLLPPFFTCSFFGVFLFSNVALHLATQFLTSVFVPVSISWVFPIFFFEIRNLLQDFSSSTFFLFIAFKYKIEK